MTDKRKKAVFDMDDVLHDFNGRACGIAGVRYEKLTSFDTHSNPDLTEEQKSRMLAAYADPRTYEGIRFDDGLCALINEIHDTRPDVHVQIRSNAMSQAIRDVKLPQLRSVLHLPEEDIIVDVIDMEAGHLKKELPKGMFLFVDDSPYNIEAADAEHLIMPARPWNQEAWLRMADVDRPETTDELIWTVRRYLRMPIAAT